MRTDNLLRRIKIAIRFVLYGKAGVRIMTCGKCGSINISPAERTAIDEEIEPELAEENVKRKWREVDVCQNCGATVVERQYWIW